MDEMRKDRFGQKRDDPDTPIDIAAKSAFPKKGTVAVKSLRIRKEHNTDSPVVAGLAAGDPVTIFETWSDGKNTWGKLAPDQWAAIVYDGETYINLA